MGDYEHPATWQKIITYLSGKELKDHFEKIDAGEIKISLKPQAVYKLPEVWKKDVASLLEKMDEIGGVDEVVDVLGLEEASRRTSGTSAEASSRGSRWPWRP